MSDAHVTRTVIDQFNAAFNAHDVAAVMALMTEDCVFENTDPPPDGERFEGQAAVRANFAQFFRDSPQAWFEFEDTFVSDDRACVRWLYRWDAGHVRGVDVFRVRAGRIAEKLSYVKG
ncbi:MAG TPA: nuclear transport factor 2 family protein [Anaerolineae bacterium]|nr:nuclear transport factor 2 family protein [Anaerolineae bacterium]